MKIFDVGQIVEGVFKGIDSVFTSDEEREKARLAMQAELQKPHILQAMANIKEAEHPNWFVAGWRPALGWLCVILLFYVWIGRDAITISLVEFGHSDVVSMLPVIDTSQIMTLVFSLLGLGGLRTYEKINGKAR